MTWTFRRSDPAVCCCTLPTRRSAHPDSTDPTADAQHHTPAVRTVRLRDGDVVTTDLATRLIGIADTHRARARSRPPSPSPRPPRPDTPEPDIITALRDSLHVLAHPGDAGTSADIDQRHHTDAGPAPLRMLPGSACRDGILELDGPGAHGCARGLMITALTQGAGHDRVIITAAAAMMLLGPYLPIPALPGLTITTDPHTALSHLEKITIDRLRADPRRAHRLKRPPLPAPADRAFRQPLLLILPPLPNSEQERMATLLRRIRRISIHGVVLVDRPSRQTITVSTDGFVSANRAAAPQRDDPRTTVLHPSSTLDLLTLLALTHHTVGN